MGALNFHVTYSVTSLYVAFLSVRFCHITWQIPVPKDIPMSIFIKISGLLEECCTDYMGHSSSSRATSALLSWMCTKMGLEWDAADLEQGLVPRRSGMWRLKPHFRGHIVLQGCPSQTSWLCHHSTGNWDEDQTALWTGSAGSWHFKQTYEQAQLKSTEVIENNCFPVTTRAMGLDQCKYTNYASIHIVWVECASSHCFTGTLVHLFP